MSEIPPPKYALIKWLYGADKGKHTPDVPTHWIKDFDYQKFLATDPDEQEPYIVEWHEGKQPLGGWPCYEGEIIQVSDHKAVLERLFKTLKCVASPNFKINTNPKTSEPSCSKTQSASQSKQDLDSSDLSDSDEEQSQRVEMLLNPEDITVHESSEHERTETPNDSIEDDSDNDSSLTKNGKTRNSAEVPDNPRKKQKQDITENVNDIQRLTSEGGISETPANPLHPTQKHLDMNSSSDDENISKIRKNDKGKRDIIINPVFDSHRQMQLTDKHDRSRRNHRDQNDNQSQLTTIMNAITVMQKQMHRLAEKENVPMNVNMASGSSMNRDDEEEDERNKNVEIGKMGSGVIIKKGQWNQAIGQATASTMATALIDAIFPYETLLISNLRGGACKVKSAVGMPPPEKHEPLNQRILKEIFATVERHHPKKYNETLVGKAINDHLNYLRRQKKKNDLLESQLRNMESSSPSNANGQHTAKEK